MNSPTVKTRFTQVWFDVQHTIGAYNNTTRKLYQKPGRIAPRGRWFLEERMMATETMQFKAELKQLLHLIIHSLYSHKDIFLRELISNASDAIDRIRFQGLTRPELLEDNAEWKIKLIADETNRTLTISDNGVGMSRETIV